MKIRGVAAEALHPAGASPGRTAIHRLEYVRCIGEPWRAWVALPPLWTFSPSAASKEHFAKPLPPASSKQALDAESGCREVEDHHRRGVTIVPNCDTARLPSQPCHLRKLAAALSLLVKRRRFAAAITKSCLVIRCFTSLSRKLAFAEELHALLTVNPTSQGVRFPLGAGVGASVPSCCPNRSVKPTSLELPLQRTVWCPTRPVPGVASLLCPAIVKDCCRRFAAVRAEEGRPDLAPLTCCCCRC